MKCAREGCENPLPEGQRKYCSVYCRELANRQRVSRKHKREDTPPSLRLRQQKHRICLGCNEEFLSTGPWNRFCPHCKQKNVSNHVRSCSISLPRHVRSREA